MPVRPSAPVLAGLLTVALLSGPMFSAAAVKPATATSGRTQSAVAEPLVAKVVIGASVQGRPIVAVHRWWPGATRTMLVIGNMHGDEQAGLRVVHRLLTRS